MQKISNPKTWALGSLILALSLTTACANHAQGPLENASSTENIVHGKNVKTAEGVAQSIVALVSQMEKGQALCTGTILANDIILTAAHCVDENPDRLVIVFKSQVKAATAADVRNADAYTQNPRWNHATAEGQGDLALIHFQGGLPAGYAPVKLANKNLSLAQGTQILMAGYGVTNGLSSAGAGTLRQTQSSIIGKHSVTEMITDGHKSSVCFGDSGGPAFVLQGDQYVQWGVANSVMNQACNEASIHTSVMSYETWIRQTAANLRKKSH